MDSTEQAHVITDEAAVTHTRKWLEGVVLKYNLCPFAHGPLHGKRVRFAVARGSQRRQILEALRQELLLLRSPEGSGLDTSLLILPDAFPDFFEFNDFMDAVEALVGRLKLEGIFQVVSFHPDYLFAEADEHDFANHTNRSPYPMLHLLREDQVSRAVELHPNVEEIPEQNTMRLRNLSDAEKTAVQSLSRCPFIGRTRES
ncbi:MAG: DUF1415 domain-containing protein [Myxococcota bacterium]